MAYLKKLETSIRSSGSILCAGLDPAPEMYPPPVRALDGSESTRTLEFCRRIIEQSKTRVAAYKFNLAFFESLGPDGLQIFDEILDSVPPGKIIIADAKRCDIPHSARRYAEAYLERFGCDAITVSPFMGLETIEPFLQSKDHAAYVITLTSNPGARDFMLRPFGEYDSLSSYLADSLRRLDSTHPGTTGMVIGATQSEHYQPVISSFPDAPLLLPGVGRQGGSTNELSRYLKQHKGLPLINVSRGISAWDPQSDDSWEVQIARNTDRFHKQLSDITQQYLGRL